MKQVIVFPRGQLTKADRDALKRAGAVAVEADDPSKVVQVMPLAEVASVISADDLTGALLEALALSGGMSSSNAFVKALHVRARNRIAAASNQER